MTSKLILDTLDEIYNKLKEHSANILSPAGYYKSMAILSDVLPTLYSHYDAYIKSEVSKKKNDVSCGNSCSNCCHYFVSSVEPMEVFLIDFTIKKTPDYLNFLEISYKNQTKFFEISKNQTNPHQADYDYFFQKIPCSFLNSQNSCSIYSIRPFSCRMFLSTSDPKYCDGRMIQHKENQNL